MKRFAAEAEALACLVSAGVVVRTVRFLSASLNEDHAFNVILPLDYDSSTARYPVLYLLHGYAFDNAA